MRVARLAGKTAAVPATNANEKPATIMNDGFMAATPKIRLSRTPETTQTPNPPITMPAATNPIASLDITQTTPPLVAPKAMRMPISCFRSVVPGGDTSVGSYSLEK